MIQCEESKIRFSFPQHWDVVNYEQSNIHINAMGPLQHTSNVDFVCYNGTKVMLLEVKNFSPKEFLLQDQCVNGKTINPVEYLINKVTAKIRDTLCGLGAAYLLGDRQLKNFSESLWQCSPTKEYPLFVLFLELGNIQGNISSQKILSDIGNKLKSRFTTLKVQVFVVDSSLDQSKRAWKAEVL